jgi:hypothetical protein
MTIPNKLLVEAVKARLAPLLVTDLPYSDNKIYPKESHSTAIAEAAIEAVTGYKHSDHSQFRAISWGVCMRCNYNGPDIETHQCTKQSATIDATICGACGQLKPKKESEWKAGQFATKTSGDK